jgi:hypothetical protein
MANISPDIFHKHPTVPFDDVVTEHRPVVRCVRGKHQRVVALSGHQRIGGAGRTRAASLQPIEIADTDAHDDDDIGRSRVAVARRGSSAIRISTRRNLRPISFRRGGSARVRSWVVNLNPLLPLVVIFYRGERGGVEVCRSTVEWRKFPAYPITC